MNILFDFDGTIADTLDPTVNVLNQFLTKRKYPPTSAHELRENGGLKGLVNSRHIPKYLIPFLVIWGRQKLKPLIGEVKTYKGLERVLQKLAKTNTLGIVTSNSKENVQVFLKNNKLDNYFHFILSDMSLFSKHIKIQKSISKYKLKPQNTVFVGDETRDVEAAKKVNLKCIAVSWGFENGKSLTKAKPDKIITRPNHLLELAF